MSDYPYREPYEEGFSDGKDEAKERIAELEAELDTFRDASLLLTGKLEDAQAELTAMRREREEIRAYCWGKVGTGIDDHIAVAIFNTIEHSAALQEKGE